MHALQGVRKLPHGSPALRPPSGLAPPPLAKLPTPSSPMPRLAPATVSTPISPSSAPLASSTTPSNVHPTPATGGPPMSPPRRVAVVDFDVHHGDGTEEIVRHLCKSLPPDSLFFASIHLYDPGDENITAFYPSSGSHDHVRSNIVNVPITPLWRRSSQSSAVRAGSRAGTARSPDGGASTSVGGASGQGSNSASGGNGVSGVSFSGTIGTSPRGSGAAPACGRLEWRAAFAQRIIPALRAYSPDLILLSSGFDGGLGDIGNSKLDSAEKYHQGLDLTPADFEWMTEQVMAVAAICCPGRVVSVLEGGYGKYLPTKLTESGWMISPENLSENCLAHVAALGGVNPRPRLD
mmetsp:Transcript_7247/g.21838  ORF Transcript_7247/g.21838 Transcript_7247/m.21838 type:complete len:350 (-) Transcript_7247:497-1546(-)